MNPSYMTPGGIWCDINEDTFIPKVRDFLKVFPSRLADYHRLLTKNPIWRARIRARASSTPSSASVTGHGPHAAGRRRGLRCAEEGALPSEQFEFDVPGARWLRLL